MGIIYGKLGNHEFVIDACSNALQRDPKFIKALINRSSAYYEQQKYDECLADLDKVKEIDKNYPVSEVRYQKVKKLVDEMNEKRKNEVIGQLKDLGNTVLGKFGLSLDNFKLNQQPGGGYNISFNQ